MLRDRQPVIVGLKQFADPRKGEQRQAAFKKDPENFVLECLRMDGAPYVGRTVLRTSFKQISIEQNAETMFRENSIISQLAATGRCPIKFGPDPNSFDPKRPNLKTDLYSFGSTEKLIRENNAVKQFPMHDFSILLMQELLARISNVAITVNYGGETFPGSYQQ